VVGEHKGIHHYTIGQKILVDKLTHFSFYVAKKDFKTQNLFIVCYFS
jgi:tRNA U34 2-thiouridine synthase MnmA/TrmU